MFLDVACKIMPNKKVLDRPNDKPYFNNALRNMRRNVINLTNKKMQH